MPASPRVCFDSSVLFKLLVPEPGSEAAEALWSSILEDGRLPVAPDFAWAEVGSALLRRTRQGLLAPALATEAWDAFRTLPLVFVSGYALAERAWTLARRWNLPTLYDAAFLAAGAEEAFWTADARLVEALGPPLPAWVHALGE